MNIAILSQNPELYSTRRLREAAIARGHRVNILSVLQSSLVLSTPRPLLHCQGCSLEDVDAVIPRIAPAITFLGTTMVRQFELMNIYVANSAAAIDLSRNKLRSLQILSQADIDIPMTGFVTATEEIPSVLKTLGGIPVVIKVLSGSQGIGVILAESEQGAISTVEAFIGMRTDVLIQEFIQEAQGKDLRCFVIGDRVVAAMERCGEPGEFRANLHRGGSARPVQLTPEEAEISVQAVQTLGLNIAGVDLLRSQRGPLVLEVNSSPGLKGIETSSGLDIADRIIHHLELHAP